MKTKKKSLYKSILLFFIIMCVMTLFSVIRVNAATAAPECSKRQTVYYSKTNMIPNGGDWYQLDSISSHIYIKNLSSKATVTNLKSSNKKFRVEKRVGLNAVDVALGMEFFQNNLNIKNGETTKISFTVKQNGKTYQLSCGVTFKPRNVISSMKLGTKDYTKKAKVYSGFRLKPTASSAKFSVKLTSGYVLDQIYVYYKNNYVKKIKNGSTISNLKNVNTIQVSYYVKSKPKYYTKPTKGFVNGQLKSPLHELTGIYFY